jgi:CubicO group peptidase (beta-lactamase class C family)
MAKWAVYGLCALGVGFAVYGLSAEPPVQAQGPSGPPAVDRDSLKSLPGDLKAIAAEQGLPGFVAYVFEGSEPVFFTASGKRRLGGTDEVRHDDRFHLGSCGKAMTAVVAARLVAREVVSWGMPLRLAFDEVHPRLVEVTLADLLRHRAGLVKDLMKTPHWKTLWTAGGTPHEVRQQVSDRLVKEAPETQPRAAFAYSNASYLVAGAVLERAAGKPWEALMQEHVFGPLNMSSCGFGAPASSGPAPWGHRKTSNGYVPVPPGPDADNPPGMGPAGTVHCSLEDWGSFIMTLVASLRGENDYLPPAILRTLVTRQAGSDYVMGWLKLQRDWSDGFLLHHAGTNTMFYASVWAAPAENRAMLVATNRGDAFPAADAMIGRMIEAFFR